MISWIMEVDLSVQWDAFVSMLEKTVEMQFLLFIVSLVILQEISMILGRYVASKQGKKERIYVYWKGRKIGLHHMHWGIIIILVGLLGELSQMNTNLLLIAVGISCILSDFVHHKLLEILHGDDEGDGCLRNPFKKKG